MPKALIVLADGYDPSEDLKATLRRDVRERLAENEYPREIEFIDELPRRVLGRSGERPSKSEKG